MSKGNQKFSKDVVLSRDETEKNYDKIINNKKEFSKKTKQFNDSKKVI